MFEYKGQKYERKGEKKSGKKRAWRRENIPEKYLVGGVIKVIYIYFFLSFRYDVEEQEEGGRELKKERAKMRKKRRRENSVLR